jgi:hypothetical protein
MRASSTGAKTVLRHGAFGAAAESSHTATPRFVKSRSAGAGPALDRRSTVPFRSPGRGPSRAPSGVVTYMPPSTTTASPPARSGRGRPPAARPRPSRRSRPCQLSDVVPGDLRERREASAEDVTTVGRPLVRRGGRRSGGGSRACRVRHPPRAAPPRAAPARATLGRSRGSARGSRRTCERSAGAWRALRRGERWPRCGDGCAARAAAGPRARRDRKYPSPPKPTEPAARSDAPNLRSPGRADADVDLRRRLAAPEVPRLVADGSRVLPRAASRRRARGAWRAGRRCAGRARRRQASARGPSARRRRASPSGTVARRVTLAPPSGVTSSAARPAPPPASA